MSVIKARRHQKIIDLINQNAIETQYELAERLRAEGFDVTQATVSRDIRELMLTKVQKTDGGQQYAVAYAGEENIRERLLRVFVDGVRSIDCAQNIVLIKTLNGMANAVGAAVDAMNYPDIMGSLAGDDTIFCVTANEGSARATVEKLRTLAKAGRTGD